MMNKHYNFKNKRVSLPIVQEDNIYYNDIKEPRKISEALYSSQKKNKRFSAPSGYIQDYNASLHNKKQNRLSAPPESPRDYNYNLHNPENILSSSPKSLTNHHNTHGALNEEKIQLIELKKTPFFNKTRQTTYYNVHLNKKIPGLTMAAVYSEDKYDQKGERYIIKSPVTIFSLTSEYVISRFYLHLLKKGINIPKLAIYKSYNDDNKKIYKIFTKSPFLNQFTSLAEYERQNKDVYTKFKEDMTLHIATCLTLNDIGFSKYDLGFALDKNKTQHLYKIDYRKAIDNSYTNEYIRSSNRKPNATEVLKYGIINFGYDPKLFISEEFISSLEIIQNEYNKNKDAIEQKLRKSIASVCEYLKKIGGEESIQMIRGLQSQDEHYFNMVRSLADRNIQHNFPKLKWVCNMEMLIQNKDYKQIKNLIKNDMKQENVKDIMFFKKHDWLTDGKDNIFQENRKLTTIEYIGTYHKNDKKLNQIIKSLYEKAIKEFNISSHTTQKIIEQKPSSHRGRLENKNKSSYNLTPMKRDSYSSPNL